MTIKTRSALMAAVMTIGAAAMAVPAHADNGAQAGFLTCHVDSGWGFVFGSTRELKCTYARDKSPVEHYVGHIHKFGVDIGYQSGGVVVWGVLASTSNIDKGALAGEYGGVSGSAAVGVGAGANVLVGGFKKSITLQPVSIEGTTGLNVAAGIAQATLEYQP